MHPLQRGLPPLVLASASPRRKALLAEHGYAFTVLPADVEESAPPHLSPADVVIGNARRKAEAVAERAPGSLILAVDTEVFFANEVFGKPRDMSEALAMLGRLNGGVHEVFSGVVLLHAASGLASLFVERTRVHFHTRSDEEMRSYLERIGPLDKAGAYAAQDDQGGMIARVEGSFTNVIGLPMEALERELQRLAEKLPAI